MTKINIKFSRIKLNDQTYLRDTKRMINKIIKEGAREFLVTVLDVVKNAPHTVGDNFPIQTGEAKGSLLPLAAALGRARQGVNIPISPAVKRVNKDGRVIYQPNRISIGRSKGKVKLGPTGRSLIYTFQYSTDVLHFQINDITGSNIPVSITPWQTMRLGFAAFERHIDNNLFQRLPKLEQYLFTVK